MSFCSHCGNEVSPNIKFCPSCGKPVSGDSNSEYIAADTGRSLRFRNAREEADYLCDYFMQKKDVYEALTNTYREEDNLKYPKKAWVYYPIGLIFMCGIPAVAMGVANDEILVTISAILAVPLLILIFLLLKKRYNAKCDALDKKTEGIQARRQAYIQELCDYYDAYGDCPIGAEYTFPESVTVITDFITSRRADTFKEALYLYEEQQAKEEMQNKLDAALYNSEIANAKSSFAAALSVYDHLTR